MYGLDTFPRFHIQGTLKIEIADLYYMIDIPGDGTLVHTDYFSHAQSGETFCGIKDVKPIGVYTC